eukprot:7327315-Ditylum_brightwellii.AAC.1
MINKMKEAFLWQQQLTIIEKKEPSTYYGTYHLFGNNNQQLARRRSHPHIVQPTISLATTNNN